MKHGTSSLNNTRQKEKEKDRNEEDTNKKSTNVFCLCGYHALASETSGFPTPYVALVMVPPIRPKG